MNFLAFTTEILRFYVRYWRAFACGRSLFQWVAPIITFVLFLEAAGILKMIGINFQTP